LRPRSTANVAELVGADTDSERAIPWLIALMVLCCDPLAIAFDGGRVCQKGVNSVKEIFFMLKDFTQ